jgi:hypothetical protein
VPIKNESITESSSTLISYRRYNHPELIELAKSDLFATLAMARPALGVFPPGEWRQMCGG